MCHTKSSACLVNEGTSFKKGLDLMNEFVILVQINTEQPRRRGDLISDNWDNILGLNRYQLRNSLSFSV